MKRALLMLALVAGLGACHRGEEQNKLIDGIPVEIGATVVPVQATQEYLFLKRDLLTVTVPVINKLASADSTFPELTSLGGGLYQFNGTDNHYGVATFQIAFHDVNGASIDPVAVRSSSETLQSVTAVITGKSSLFTYNENMLLMLDVVNYATSTYHLSGTSNFTGINGAASYTLAYNMPPAVAIFEGLFSGTASATGSGGTPSQPANLTIEFASNRSIDGTVQWEGKHGTYHVDITGPGYVVTDQTRILIN